jgi:hypothetical protein
MWNFGVNNCHEKLTSEIDKDTGDNTNVYLRDGVWMLEVDGTDSGSFIRNGFDIEFSFLLPQISHLQRKSLVHSNTVYNFNSSSVMFCSTIMEIIFHILLHFYTAAFHLFS